MEQVCNAIKANGEVCGKNARNDGKCGIHHAAILKVGPNATALKELKYRQRKQIYDFGAEYRKEDQTGMSIGDLIERGHVFEADIAIMKAQHRREAVNLKNTQDRMIRETGVDPDAPARARAQVEQAEQRRIHRARLEEMRAADILGQRNDAQRNWQNRAAQLGEAVRIIIPAQRELANFAADPQNVHTTEAVNQTKEIVARIRQVAVPEDYRWDSVNSSKTPFEIGLECKLSQRAAWQMISQYAQATAIYDIEEGIYGKVLDSVWQYVKISPEKEDLCKILRNEMEDNVGMCAQGNLSRICNILAGYMDGVGSQESLAEKLGTIFGKLADIEDPAERFDRAAQELVWNKVPKDQWMTWAEPLAEDAEQAEMLMSALGY